ncbi:DUF3710 domain-containing protein [Labedella endophytica]|uniref:DUF3710 domain-containing protein n=1 Tax=Labedella endophytica TaxID=1523160 RepID=A0A433JRZ7_9MICO|nr:DUF3710 domain-containing protein [Labedella endophytica]RUR00759.1 DUF3710 domain-containing protein [Labedella endophytica]
MKRSKKTTAEAAAVTTDVETIPPTDDVVDAIDAPEGEPDLDLDAKSAPADRAENGPFDEAEANAVRPYIDLGGVKILPREGLNLRLEVEESSKRIVAVGLDYAGSSLQVQPFAAPRTTGLWHETRLQIVEQITKQGGTVTDVEGPFGPEIRAQVPVAAADGSGTSSRVARFVGIDGPRWFLRGVIAGEGTSSPEAAEKIEDLFRSVVVVRGTQPMPPRDLIPLKMPTSASTDAAPTDA